MLNRFNLASMLAGDGLEDFESLRDALAPWTVILNLTAGDRFPREKIAYEEETVMAIAAPLGITFSHVSGEWNTEQRLLPMLRSPWTHTDAY